MYTLSILGRARALRRRLVVDSHTTGTNKLCMHTQSHTTGPNCWLAGDITISKVGDVDGEFPHERVRSSEDALLAHVGIPTFVNFSETYFSCVDGRYLEGTRVLATAGGDAAEFMLALVAAQNLGLYLDQFVIDGLFRRYVDNMGSRRFYMHTDDHAWHHVLETLELPHDFSIYAAPDRLKDALLSALVQPANVGCGHIKGMLLYPTMYNIPNSIPTVSSRRTCRASGGGRTN